jgi:predicted nucleic acid-binding protein
VIYIDSSVALAYLLDEGRQPTRQFWRDDLVSSRLLEYEVWNRINARKLSRSRDESVRALLPRISMIELGPDVLSRALEPFPVAVRTLDALHLASIEYLRSLGQEPELASYDNRLNAVARALNIPLHKV